MARTAHPVWPITRLVRRANVSVHLGSGVTIIYTIVWENFSPPTTYRAMSIVGALHLGVKIFSAHVTETETCEELE